jgi:hypothetical protein
MNDSEAAESKYLPRINAGGINWLDITAELPAEVPYGSDGSGRITWNGTRYVYVSPWIGIPAAYSADLLHWTAGETVVFSSSGGNLYTTPYVAWGGPAGKERFVAVRRQSVSYSPDGVTWTESRVALADPINERFRSLIWGGPAGQEVFVAGTDDGIYWSSDGTAWTKAESGGSSSVRQLIWTGENFVAMLSTRIRYSSDGKEWKISPKTFSSNGNDGGFSAIAYTGTEYIVLTWERGGQNIPVYKLWSSRDLETWTEETVLPGQDNNSYWFLLYKDGTIYTYQYVHTGPSKYIYSTDKTTWTVALEFPIIGYGGLYMLNGKEFISYDGKLFVQE